MFVRFLDGVEDVAESRGSAPLERDQMDLLERMADGRCEDKRKRKEAIKLMAGNREAMEFFACRLKGEDYTPALENA